MTKINANERVRILGAHYDSQDEQTKIVIDDIGAQIFEGVRRRGQERKKATGFGEKSQLEVVWAISRLMNGNNN